MKWSNININKINMYEVQFIKWKNIWTKSIGTITIWLETNRLLFDILQDKYWKVFNFIVRYQWSEVQLPCSINEEWSNSMMWTKDNHWVVKIDIVWGNLLMIDQIQSGNLFINI